MGEKSGIVIALGIVAAAFAIPTTLFALTVAKPASPASGRATQIAMLIMPPPGGGGETVPMTVTVMSGSTPLANQTVNVTIKDPYGTVVGSGTLTTSSTGAVSGAISATLQPSTTYTITAVYAGATIGTVQYSGSQGTAPFTSGSTAASTTSVTFTG